MEKPVAVKPHLPHAALPSADWADCYQLPVRGPRLAASDAARMALAHFPGWIQGLMRLRNFAARFAGLKLSTHHWPAGTEMIGIFPVVSRSDSEVVLGFDDRHLDFRIVIDVSDRGDGSQVVSAMTLVNRKILLGRIYIAVITPFHKLVVASMLANVGRAVAPIN